ncbi:TRAP transporter large permease subunit [Shimia thalassica]|uniref:TRAP transporter large permease n=1 Tax=Shimia thalassica TaxID=1715693 RepID=UPI0027332C64|nr:TRAP transporter large permease subunit [Shimia thalassica]MDP2520576.1 TRAP transporter large permease subunit [Shimia thalassica]MDP2582048.1 TRAP transporter large permease subunit [Shimia thalassica]
MTNEVLTVAMLVVMAIGVFSGFPVALVLAGTGFLGFLAAVWVGVTDFQHLGLIYLRSRGVLTNESVQFTSVPMLIFLGLILNASGVAETMFRLLGRLLTGVPGRYAIATLLIGLVLAPAAGVIGASVITVALVAYAPMMASGYAPRTAGAAVAASGALGVVFPPAVMLFFISNVFYLRIGLMYVALIVPVLLMVTSFAAYFAITLRKTIEIPLDAPKTSIGSDLLFVFASVAVIASIPLSIILGFATLTEAAGVGVFGALLVALARKRLSFSSLNSVTVQTSTMTSMVFFIVLGASVFSLSFHLVGGPDVIFGWISAFDLTRWELLAILLGVIIILGFVFDWIEVLLVFVPVLMPIISELDFSDHVGSAYFAQIWIGGLIALALQTSFLTPPFGYALFFAKMAAPKGINLSDIYRGAVPLVAIEIVLIAALILFPQLVTWLPEMALGSGDIPQLIKR